jgi:hypothetical protein
MAPSSPFGATNCGVDGTYALRSAVAVRSSPEAAQRCAEGAGLDGGDHGRSTITRAVKSGHLLHRCQAADRHAKYTAKLHQLDGRYPVPAPVAEIAFHNKVVVYTILFHAAAEALRSVAADSRYLGAEIGAIAVLHTWGQALHHHPHLHCIVPGGGISPDQTRWIACPPGFFLSVRALSGCFRDLFLQRLRAAFANGELRFSGSLDTLVSDRCRTCSDVGVDAGCFAQLETPSVAPEGGACVRCGDRRAG